MHKSRLWFVSRVISSCKTKEQLEVAVGWARRVLRTKAEFVRALEKAGEFYE